jgi:hypothetical protein
MHICASNIFYGSPLPQTIQTHTKSSMSDKESGNDIDYRNLSTLYFPKQRVGVAACLHLF